ncbi:MAG TPA: ankyrin repeat domain-containing protein [Luteitalea sp.]|nr:ankyrin repeat domain-containing protein [Luteitalea sp.]
MPRSLPDRPDLDHLKHQAKALLRDIKARDAEALGRLATLPAFAAGPLTDERLADVALHDAQSIVAREYGQPSWQALRDEVQARTLSFETAVEEFVRCATGGARPRAERILAWHPAVAGATLHTALVLGDVDAVRTKLAADPGLATRPGGPQDWEPLLYVCHTSMADRDRDVGFVEIARALLTAGANPNAEYHWNWHPELPRTALWGALCVVRSLALAETLLAAGANPTDGVCAHITGGGGNLPALELLAQHGLRPDGIPGGVPPLVYMMTWGTIAAGPVWLLDHGADPNLAWGDEGEAPLHVAARRWDVPMVEQLLAHGADPLRPRADGRTAHALAEMHGNRDVAAALAAVGAGATLSPVDRFVAACARADRAEADALLAADPSLRDALQPAHHLLLHRPAETGDARVLETMVACGFDKDVRDRDRVTPLHRAAMGGHPEATRVLIDAGADLHALDGMFAAPPLVWAVEGREHAQPGADHVAVARLLIAAGSPQEWHVPEGAPDPERTLDGLIELRREAAI